MTVPTEPAEVSHLLARHWGLERATVRSLDGGMNSRTWSVEHAGASYVAKAVEPPAAPELTRGAEAAAALTAAGIVVGAPVRTLEGRLLLGAPALVLLRHVPGRELAGDSEEEQERIAGTLARAHVAGSPGRGPAVAGFAADWLSTDAPGVREHRWLVDAVEAVRQEAAGLVLTWTLLHTDPAPGAFLHDDATGRTGLIDWAGARRGPVLYDVASAVMYLGGPSAASAFLAAYRSVGPLDAAEVDHLDVFRRFRECVQGVYFAGRLARGDLTGVADRTANEKGLRDARRRLLATRPPRT